MASGPEHYMLAEELLGYVKENGGDFTPEGRADSIAMAQVHAMLALAAATATGSEDHPRADWDEWQQAASRTAVPPEKPGDAATAWAED